MVSFFNYSVRRKYLYKSIIWVGVYGIFYGFAISCKTSQQNTTPKKENPYIQYSSEIMEGEAHILNEKYMEALEHYQKAFQLIDKPLAADCFTALQLSAWVNNTKQFKILLLKAMQRGLEPAHLTTDTLLNTYIKHHKLEPFMAARFPKCNNLYRKGINRFLLDTVLKLSSLDNKWKIHYLDSLVETDTLNKDRYWKKYDSIVSYIVEKKLIPLIRQYGYPGERSIGFERVRYKQVSYDYAFVNNWVKIILWHYYSYPRTCNYNPLFLEEVKKGNLIPKHYASFIDFQAKYGKERFCKVSHYNEHHTTEDVMLFESINAAREQLGLEPFEEKSLKSKRGQQICKEIREGKKYKHIKLFYWCG